MAVTINETTLAAAMTADQGTVSLTSGATVVAGHIGYCDREAMLFQSPVQGSTTLWNVLRGWAGTPATAHAAAGKIKTGPSGHFGNFNPSGAANAANVVAVPFINVNTGDVFDIAAGKWSQVGVGGVAQGASAWP